MKNKIKLLILFFLKLIVFVPVLQRSLKAPVNISLLLAAVATI